MHCPRCGSAMTLELEGLHADIPVHRCPACAALWMAPASLDRLDDNINVDAAGLDWRPTGEDKYACTVCPSGYRAAGALLHVVALGSAPDLVMHRCSQCDGLLLDAATLEGIQAAVIRA